MDETNQRTNHTKENTAIATIGTIFSFGFSAYLSFSLV
jgi:hypothetical protein